MKLAIVCAMEEELTKILENIPLKLVDKFEKAGNCYFEYEYVNFKVIAVVCGIGKVNAAVTTQILLSNFVLDAVINVGVAGSLSPKLGFGDVVIATDLVEHDFDVTAFGMPLGQIARMDTFSFVADDRLNKLLLAIKLEHHQVVAGRIVSGDQFIDNKQKAEFLHDEFGALACEMEGAAIAHVCYLNKVPFAVVRSLSDMAGRQGDAIYSFNDLKYMAAEHAALVTRNLIAKIAQHF